MITYSDKKLHEEIKTLPESTQKAVRSLDIANTVNDIGAKYEIILNEIGYLYDEVKKVITGEARADEFVDNVKKIIDSEQHVVTSKIAEDINREIFIKIREAMRLSGEKMGEKVTETPKRPLETTIPTNISRQQTELTKPTQTIPLPPKPLIPSPAKPSTPPTNLPVGDKNTMPVFSERQELLSAIENPKELSAPSYSQNAEVTRKNLEPSPTAPSVPKPPEQKPIPPPPIPIPQAPKNPPSQSPPGSIIDERLSRNVSAGNEVKRYTMDPYREPVE